MLGMFEPGLADLVRGGLGVRPFRRGGGCEGSKVCPGSATGEGFIGGL